MTKMTTETEPLYSSLGDDPDLAEIVELFVDEMPERVSSILRLFDASDWDELRRIAHQLKGAAGSYGFDAISPEAMRLEGVLLRGATEEEIRDAVDDLVDLCRRARAGTPR